MADEKMEAVATQFAPERSPLNVNPGQVVAEAREQATLLMEIVRAGGLSVTFGDHEYVQVEAWQTTARFNGALIDTGWTRRVVFDGRIGYQAQARLRRLSDGAVLGTAEALCMMDEQLERSDGTLYDRWTEEYQAASMAQTRAQGKMGRMSFAWVVVLAGFSSTPAEEIDGVHKSPTKITFPFGDHKGQSPSDLDLPELRYTLGFWRKKTQEPGKYQAGNARIAAAIEAAIAEKSAKVGPEKAGSATVPKEATDPAPAVEGPVNRQPDPGNPIFTPSGVPSQDDQLRIRIVELASALDWPPSKLQVRCKKLTGEMDIDKMGFEQLGAVAGMLADDQLRAGKA